MRFQLRIGNVFQALPVLRNSLGRLSLALQGLAFRPQFLRRLDLCRLAGELCFEHLDMLFQLRIGDVFQTLPVLCNSLGRFSLALQGLALRPQFLRRLDLCRLAGELCFEHLDMLFQLRIGDVFELSRYFATASAVFPWLCRASPPPGVSSPSRLFPGPEQGVSPGFSRGPRGPDRAEFSGFP